MIRVVVKGTAKNAKRAASRRGIALRGCVTGKHGVFCDAPCSSVSEVMRWYTEKPSLKRGRGEAPGALTFYSAKCTKAGRSLSGGSRRRRRR